MGCLIPNSSVNRVVIICPPPVASAASARFEIRI
jgi:hypothetical protein